MNNQSYMQEILLSSGIPSTSKPLACVGIQPGVKSAERIAKILEAGKTRGIGDVRWELRTHIGNKFSQKNLNMIANQIRDGFAVGENWALRVIYVDPDFEDVCDDDYDEE